MKKQDLIIIGVGLSGVTTIASRIASMQIDAIIISDKKQVEKAKNIFETESILIYNFREDWFEPLTDKHKFYENEPSKFIGKPKNNFKSR